MENGSNGSPVKDGKALPTLPTVQKWVKRDVDAAVYFLRLLQQHPDVLDKLSELLYEDAKQRKRDAELLEK